MNKKLESNFILPAYDNDCLSNVPGTILTLFGIKAKSPTVSREYFARYLGGEYQNIILFLIDAFGLIQWRNNTTDLTLFQRLKQKDRIYSITSIFPSTTAAALSTISSGLTPAEHGLFEWYLYLEEIDATIETLPFKELGGQKRDSLLDKKIRPEILFDNKTIYETLNEHEVNSFSFINREYAGSVYSQRTCQGSTTVPYLNFSDLIVKLRTQVEEANGNNCYFVYWDRLDSLSHEYGPNSQACRAELSKISHLFLTEFTGRLTQEKKDKTLLVLTADHGQINVDWKEATYLDKDPLVMKSLQKDGNGEPILPTGGPRVVFLHIKESQLETVYNHLKTQLGEKAEVMKTETAIELGLFGKKKVATRFRNRLGNLLLLTRKDQTIWREYAGKKKTYAGHHGGLSEEEMLIPLCICGLNELDQ